MTAYVFNFDSIQAGEVFASVAVRLRCLNQFTGPGMPISIKIA